MRIFVTAIAVFLLASVTAANADTVPEIVITLSKNTFIPATIDLPANQKTKLIITNKDDAAAEFESYDLNREKVVPANSTITIFIDPLDPGTYTAFDDFHRDTTNATFVVK